MMNAFEYAKLFLFRPTDAAEAAEKDGAIDLGLKVYALWVAASLLYLWLKPYDFPDVNAPVPTHVYGFTFWLRVAFWEPVLAVMNVALAALVLDWMREGWLPLRTAVATFWSAVPLILTIAYTKAGLPRAAFGALMIVWALPGAWVARRVPAADWRKAAAFLLGLNAVGLVVLIPEIAATAFRSDLAYKASLFLSVAWLLVSGGVGLARLFRTSVARAVLAFLFANLVLNLVIAAAYLLHWLPLEVLKVLVYV